MSTSLPLAGAGPGRRALLFAIVLALLLGGLAYLLGRIGPQLFPSPEFSARAAPDCNLRAAACSAHFDDGHTLHLSIEPQGIPVNQPLRAKVRIEGFAADSVAIEFRGVDMDMGLIRHELIAAGDGRFVGEAVLPVCIRQRMMWQATVTALGSAGIHQAAFDFEVRRP